MHPIWAPGGPIINLCQEKPGFVARANSLAFVDSPNLAAMFDPAIVMNGARCVGENPRMHKVADFAGRTFDVALSAAVQAAVSCVWCVPHARGDALVGAAMFKYEKGRSNRYGALWNKVRERSDS